MAAELINAMKKMRKVNLRDWKIMRAFLSKNIYDARMPHTRHRLLIERKLELLLINQENQIADIFFFVNHDGLGRADD